MKTKPFRIALIIITILISLYLWIYPYTSYEYVSNLKEKAIKDSEQINQLSDSSSAYIYKIKNYVRIDSQYQLQYELMDSIDNIFRQMGYDFDVPNIVFQNAPQKYVYLHRDNPKVLYKWNTRLNPLMYLVPKHLLEERKVLEQQLTILQNHQERILNLIDNNTISKIIKDSFILNIQDIKCQYHKIHFLEIFPVSTQVRLQIQQNRFGTLEVLGQKVEEKMTILKKKYEVVQPDFKIAKLKLKQGENNNIEITTTEKIQDNTVRCRINNERIPFKNGKAVYNFKANQKSKQEIEVFVTFVNPFTKAYNTFKNSIKYEVY